jgi:hypothetical protein
MAGAEADARVPLADAEVAFHLEGGPEPIRTVRTVTGYYEIDLYFPGGARPAHVLEFRKSGYQPKRVHPLQPGPDPAAEVRRCPRPRHKEPCAHVTVVLEPLPGMRGPTPEQLRAERLATEFEAERTAPSGR